MIVRTKRLFFLFLLSSISLRAMNLLQPYDSLIRPPYDGSRSYHFNIFVEKGFKTKSFNDDCAVDSPLHIWHSEQNALKMLEGFDPNSPIGQLRTQINANDDGVRGHFAVGGDLDLGVAAAVDARFFFLDDWFVSAHLPLYSMQLNDVCFADRTQDKDDADCRVKDLLTNNFVHKVKELGGPDLCGWKRTGVGDLTVLVNWFRDFPQPRPFLKNARLNWRVGLGIPSGKRRDEDVLFGVPFGNDGSFSIPFGLGLDLTLGKYFKIGLDVQLTHIFGNTRLRRIKTQADQTELLLLQKAQAHKDFGLVQRFNLYFQFYKLMRGFSFLVGYQFLKHGEDTLALCSNTFSQQIANTAESLKEWTIHHMVLNASYDFSEHFSDDARIKPYLSLFVRMPFNGKRSVGNRAIGIILGFDF